MIAFRSILLSSLLAGSLFLPASAAGLAAPHQLGLPGHPAFQHTDRHQLPVGLDLPLNRAQAHAAVAYPARWQQQAELSAHEGAIGDHFGGPVALSGGTALVGAWDKNHGTGAAYIFVRTGSGWTEQATLSAAGGSPGDWFGASVALVGDTALVGAPLAARAGAVYVFTRDGSRWTQEARLIARDGAAGDWFGRAVALRDDIALVGAWYKQHHAGAAYVFVRHGSGWSQQAKLTARDGVAEDYFGTSVALSGNTALVGAVGKYDGNGAAYAFVRNGACWTQQALLTAGDGKLNDAFGTAVALSGETVLVGAGSANGNRGAAYVFVRAGSHWSQQARLTANDGVAFDWFGWTVALSDDTALIGAWYRHNRTGAAYIFMRRKGSWAQQAELTAGNAATDDCFGSSVALSRGTSLVSAGFKNHATGAAYVFGYIQTGAQFGDQAGFA